MPGQGGPLLCVPAAYRSCGAHAAPQHAHALLAQESGALAREAAVHARIDGAPRARRRGRRAHRALARQRVRVCDVHAHVRCCHPGVRGRFAGLDRGLHGRG